MKKHLPFVVAALLVCISQNLFSQIAISPSSTNPDPKSMLDVISTNTGLLIPRVNLGVEGVSGGNLFAANPEALLVYNTNAAYSSGKGYYYWNGTSWERVMTESNSASGTVTNVATGSGLTGGPITSTGTIAIANSGVTNSMLQNNSVTVNTGTGLSGGGTVALGGTLNLTNTGVTNVATGSGLTGGPITNTGTISIANSGITNSMLQNNSVTVNTGTGLSGGGTVALGGTLNLTNTGVTNVATGTGLTGGPITNTGTISLANVGTAGTYTKVTTNAQGQVTSGTTLSASDIPDLSAGYIQNQIAGAQSANFWISGKGAIGSGLSHSNLQNGALDIGNPGLNYGGGSSWNSNTAGILMEALDNTEIAVHDAGTRIASLMYFEGEGTNRITIGRNMGWDALATLATPANVGIGTTTPRAKLEVAGSVVQRRYNEVAGSYGFGTYYEGSSYGNVIAGMEVEHGDAGGSYAGAYSNRVHFLTHLYNGSWGRRMTIDYNGSVGIGTTAPAEVLSVVTPTGAWQSRFQNSTGSGADVYLAHGSGYGIHVRGWNASDGIYALQMYNNGAETNAFWNSGRVALGMVGNVGINTNSPAQKLHVAGVTRTSQGIEVNNGSVTADNDYGIYWHGAGDRSYAIYRESGAWNSPYPDLRIGFHTGIKIGASSSYGGTKFYNNSDMATQIMSVGDGDNNVRVNALAGSGNRLVSANGSGALNVSPADVRSGTTNGSANIGNLRFEWGLAQSTSDGAQAFSLSGFSAVYNVQTTAYAAGQKSAFSVSAYSTSSFTIDRDNDIDNTPYFFWFVVGAP